MKMKQYWHIRNCSLFQKLKADELQKLEEQSRFKQFTKGCAIYLPMDYGESAFLLAGGRIRICTTTPDGKQAIQGFIEPGELFGELALVEPGVREERAEAVVDSCVYLLPGKTFQELMESSTTLSLGVSKLIGLRRKRVERRLRSLLFHSNRDRLGHLLIDLLEQYGQQTSEGIILGIKLSHQDLSAIIGATRETVTNVLGEFQSAGYLRISRQKIMFTDLRGLAESLGLVVPKLPSTMQGKTAGLESA
jgi:CRP-like cAMP-binding protein